MKERMLSGKQRRKKKPATDALPDPILTIDAFKWPRLFIDISIEHSCKVAREIFAHAPAGQDSVQCNKWLLVALVKFIEGAPVGLTRSAMEANLRQ